MDTLIGTLFHPHLNITNAKHVAMSETDRSAMIRTISFTVPCLHNDKHFVTPYMVYVTFRLELLKELIIAKEIPIIVENYLAAHNDNTIQQYNWQDIETLGYVCNKIYIGPGPIYISPIDIVLSYGQQLPR